MTQNRPEECDHCQWETDELELAEARPDVKRWLCQVCRSTFAGNVSLYPRQYSQSDRAITGQISWGINYLASLIQADVPNGGRSLDGV